MTIDRAWEFTCLLPVWAGDDVEQFRVAVASVAQSSTPPTVILLCQDGDLPYPLAAAVEEARHRWGTELARNPGPRGLHHNLNHAMGGIHTAWVCRADADDINLPGRFAAQLGFLRSNPDVSVLGGAIIEFWPDGRTRQKSLPLDHESLVRFARWRSPINHMTAFFRSDLLNRCGGYPNIPMKEDYGLWLRMIAAGARLANLAEPLVRARLGADFHARRSGPRNIASEYALFQLKRRVPGIGGTAAAAAFVARSSILAMRGPATVIYERFLRQ